MLSLRYLHCLMLPVGTGRLPSNPIAYPRLFPPHSCKGLQNDGGGLGSDADFLCLDLLFRGFVTSPVAGAVAEMTGQQILSAGKSWGLGRSFGGCFRGVLELESVPVIGRATSSTSMSVN